MSNNSHLSEVAKATLENTQETIQTLRHLQSQLETLEYWESVLIKLLKEEC